MNIAAATTTNTATRYATAGNAAGTRLIMMLLQVLLLGSTAYALSPSSSSSSSSSFLDQQHVVANPSPSSGVSSAEIIKVLVTGAAGKTGRIILSKLENDDRYEPKGKFISYFRIFTIVTFSDVVII